MLHFFARDEAVYVSRFKTEGAILGQRWRS